ncbi:hypothetical protein ACQUSR_16990 [Streptomyces sp. P1-3]|uniref:hypothetical protein n=1 Tax=Streptomyces sp. P1-3 TaxID=3421658 RepID=UPI003D360A9E
MRKSVTGIALAVATAVLVSGCGGDEGDDKDTGKKDGAAKSSVQPTGDAPGKGATREVTLEVLKGTGKVLSFTGKMSIYYNLESNGSEESSLPWKKTATLTLTDAERRVGYHVSIVPGSLKGPDGMAHPAPCVIKVDGKKVADNQGGKSRKGCAYELK